MLGPLVRYYRCLFYFIVQHGSFTDCPFFADDKSTRVHLFSLALIFRLWELPHYRNGTFQDDMVKNLRNVAVPGTGMPLSWFCHFKVTVLLFILVIYPVVCLVSAVHTGGFDVGLVVSTFYTQLLNPQDWFSFWRLNCRLATYHSYVTNDDGYKMEDKLTFLVTSQERDIAVSPFFTCSGVVAKHRNEEGGLGFMSFSNAVNGGDWILQETLQNDQNLQKWLPSNAPLSTFRIITASRGGLSHSNPQQVQVKGLSCVWRAGRAGAATDHSSVLFDVNRNGYFGKATTNAHWYKLGLHNALNCKWVSHHDITTHPDTGVQITGGELNNPTVEKMYEFACHAHRKLMPGVPLSGWDVALTNKGMLLLECNLSCNFFRGHFDQEAYYDFVADYFQDLESLEQKKH